MASAIPAGTLLKQYSPGAQGMKKKKNGKTSLRVDE